MVKSDKINLLTNANGITTDDSTIYVTLTEGVSLTYDLTVKQDGNSITAQIDGATEQITKHDSNNVINIYVSDSGIIYGGTSFTNIYGGYAPNGSTSGVNATYKTYSTPGTGNSGSSGMLIVGYGKIASINFSILDNSRSLLLSLFYSKDFKHALRIDLMRLILYGCQIPC